MAGRDGVRMREEEASTDEGEEGKRRGFLVAAELRLLDGIIAFFQRLRNRVEPVVVEEEDPRGGGRRRSRGRDEEAPAPVAAPKHGRLRSFLLWLAALLAVGIGGMLFSYQLLSKAIDSNEVIIDYLRDEVVRLEREDRRSANAKARYLETIAEHERKIGEHEEAMNDCRAQAEELRKQLAAETALREPVYSGGVRTRLGGSSGIGARSGRTTPEKTANCVTGSANAAANLARCVDEFNRK